MSNEHALSGFVTLVVLAMFSSGASAATAANVNIGTLTCTVAPLEGDNTNEREMTCQFQAQGGPGGRYRGVIRRTSGPPFTDANLVLMWAVLAPKKDPPIASLAGRYVSSATSAPPPSAAKVPSTLVGNPVPIELRSMTPIGNRTETTVIVELQLSSLPV